MKDNAVLQRRFWHRGGLLVAVPLAAAAVLLAGLVGSAPAAKVVGKDGKIHACYKGKGKAKGSVRLVAKKGKCRRGERRVKWSVAGPPGPAGAQGANGHDGAPGPVGPAGPSAVTTLETKVSELTSRVTQLEGVLAGVTNSDLTGLLSDVPVLESTVAGLGTQVGALCTQADTLTDQVNGVGSSVDALIDNLLGSLVGGVLGTQPAPPVALPEFTCPTP